MALVAALSPSLVPPPASAPPGDRAFVSLDERLVAAHAGVIVVRAHASVHAPIAHHAARRLRTAGWLPLDATVRDGEPIFREVAMLLGVAALPNDRAECAAAIAVAAADHRAAIITTLPKDGTWDRSVAVELARTAAERRALLVFLTDGSTPAWNASVFHVAADLGPADKLCWLSAVAEEAQSDLPGSDLRALEAWWVRARHLEPRLDQASFDELGASSRHLLTSIVLAGRSLPLSALANLSRVAAERAAADVRELIATGHIESRGSFVSASATDIEALEATASNATRIAVAEWLTSGQGGRSVSGAAIEVGVEPDPWAYARAAELLVAAGAYERADAAIARARRSGTDPQLSSEIGARWFRAVVAVSGASGVTLRVNAANRALLLGEAADALRWCESAAAIEPNDPAISLLMGRALMQLGDLVAARVCLAKAEAAAEAVDDPLDVVRDLVARVAAERAEVCYLGGDLEGAAVHAHRAIDLARAPGTRLAARSTLGKLLLARGAWDLADEHFADDMLVASSIGDTTAELRARLNRAIALLSKGMLDDARTLLTRVLEDATRLQEGRAGAYALSNLGLVAYRQHDYGAALQYWERTVRLPQALRGRLATALTIGNLADLRLRLGLVDHAEHAIAFGRQLLAGKAPPRCAALFKWVSAQIALARRDTALARREIDGAVVEARASGDLAYLESAYAVAARVALEDGDLARATDALVLAENAAKSPRARAEVAIVRASHLRALGRPALESANEALQGARASGEEDLLLEIHTLLALIHRDAGDVAAWQAHCSHAIAVRDQVAAGLPVDIRSAFLAKPDVVAISRLQAAVVEVEDGAPARALAGNALGTGSREDDVDDLRGPRSSRPESAPFRPLMGGVHQEAAREMVGDDPQIRSLASAIRKVARASSSVLIRGESGTGKELVAGALHRASDRAAGPLVSVNCAALVETLLLSELFGHEKGAFTGASARRRGRFEMAEGGTLFLDEIGDVSSRTQIALLRVLQEKTFERVGGGAPIRADVRVVCATHRDLRAMVERGEFREDLYYRLRGITLEVPPLRARLGDLPKIADHLLRRIAAERGVEPKELSPHALDLLCRHRWPGNIRELENVLRAVALFAESNVIDAGDLIDNVDELRSVAQSRVRTGESSSQRPLSSLRSSVNLLPAAPLTAIAASSTARTSGLQLGKEDSRDGACQGSETGEASATAVAYSHVRQGSVSLSDLKRRIERDCIAFALAETNGNITRAAALLGMKRPRLSQLVKQYGLSVATSTEGNS